MQDRWLEHLEKLAALDLSEDERIILRGDIARIIHFTSDLPEESTEDQIIKSSVSDSTHIGGSGSPIQFSYSLFISSAPQFKNGFLLIPPIWPHRTGVGND